MIYYLHMGAFILRTLVGLAVVALGFFMAWKTEWFLRILGRNAWAEQNLGGGGSRVLYKIVGFIFILIGFIIVTDLWDNFITWAVTGLFIR